MHYIPFFSNLLNKRAEYIFQRNLFFCEIVILFLQKGNAMINVKS